MSDLFNNCFYQLARILPDANDRETDQEETENPSKIDKDAQVYFWLRNSPSACKNGSQRIDGVCQRKEIGKVAQVSRHAFHGPQNTAEQHVGKETAQR